MSEAAISHREAVLTAPELLESTLEYLVGSSRQAIADLGRAALVCRLWQSIALADAFWSRILHQRFPVLALPPNKARVYMIERGRAMEPRVWIGESWRDGLRIHFELWDEADGFPLLSVEGPLYLCSQDEYVTLRAEGAGRREVVGPAFSAVDRDPEQRRLASIGEYFSRAHDPDLPAIIRARVTVIDSRTGLQAVLWSSGKSVGLLSVEPLEFWRDLLPEGTIEVYCNGAFPLITTESELGPFVAYIGFFVQPLEGQEGAAEEHRRYRLSGGEEER
jgi:hypothetical protein